MPDDQLTPDRYLDAIPPPEHIREQLAQLLREVDLLRALLRVAERKEREQQFQRGDE